MNSILTMTIELETARHKREIAAAFAKLRAELTPPPVLAGDPSWKAMQRALNAACGSRLQNMQAAVRNDLLDAQMAAAQVSPQAAYNMGMGSAYGNAAFFLFGQYP